jgi:hypothetical protein
MFSSGERVPIFSEFSLENLYGCRLSSGLIMKFYYDIKKSKQCETGENRTRVLLIFNHPSWPLGQSVSIKMFTRFSRPEELSVYTFPTVMVSIKCIHCTVYTHHNGGKRFPSNKQTFLATSIQGFNFPKCKYRKSLKYNQIFTTHRPPRP